MKLLKEPKMSLFTLFGTQRIQKLLIIPAFCNGYNVPTLAKEKTCHIISQSQVCIDLHK